MIIPQKTVQWTRACFEGINCLVEAHELITEKLTVVTYGLVAIIFVEDTHRRVTENLPVDTHGLGAINV